MKLEVFPSKSLFVTCDHLNGIKLGGLCKFKIQLSEKEKNSLLDVKVTSNDL